MVTELELSSNNLLTYSLIYGFSQDGQNEFTGSINYICSWLNCSRPTAMKSLTYLCERQLIIKTSTEQNGVIFNRYKVNLQVVKKLDRGGKETLQGSKETLQGGGKETLPNNTNINNNSYNDNYKEEISKIEMIKNINLNTERFNIITKQKNITEDEKTNYWNQFIEYLIITKKEEEYKGDIENESIKHFNNWLKFNLNKTSTTVSIGKNRIR